MILSLEKCPVDVASAVRADRDSGLTNVSVINLEHSIAGLSADGDATTVEYAAIEALDQYGCISLVKTTEKETLKATLQAREEAQKSIMRFVRESDRLTALASVLLKSMAFYRSIRALPYTANEDGYCSGHSIDDLYNQLNPTNEQFDVLPIVILPRTKFNRPYIPYLPKQQKQRVESITTSSNEGEGENENPAAKFSISHQYPYIAMVQSRAPLEIGMDLVLFQFQKNEFTPTTNDFLHSFESSFTPWEWKRIQYHTKRGLLQNEIHRSDESKLKEFFLRWAMKEAYTKALGLGMHVEFSSFETRLIGIDECDNSDAYNSIWDTVTSGVNASNRSTRSGLDQGIQHQYSVLGKIHHIPPKSSSLSLLLQSLADEAWEFIFIPIPTTTFGHSSRYAGCCCICREQCTQSGIKLPSDLGEDTTKVLVENMDLSDLLKLHKKVPSR
jgi:phosphopantetheinyl transferase